MADNTILNAGSGGDVIATDDIAGVKHQLVKVEFGAADSATQVSASDPLPIVQIGATPAGTNNIGDVDVLTLPNVTLAAGTNTNEVVGDVAHGSPAGGNPLLVGAFGASSAPTSVDENDAVNVWATRQGALAVTPVSSGGTFLSDATNGVDVDVTRLPAIPAGTNNIGDVDVLTMPNVTLAAGTNTNEVVGDVAHDVAVAGNPLLVCGRAETAEDSDANTSANRTDTDGDATRLAVDRYGVLFVRHGTPFQFSFTNKSASQQTNAAIHAAPAAGLSIYITDIYFAANGAVNVTIETATPTTLWAYYAAAGGDGATFQPKVPIKLPAATALQYDTSAAVEHTLVVCGYIAP